MLHRVWVLKTAAVALLAFTCSLYAQSTPSIDRLTLIPDGSGQDVMRSDMQNMNASLTGNVYGDNNTPIRDAKIEIRNVQSGLTAAYGYTSSGGSFELPNLPQGNYDVIATSGLSEAHEQIRMDGSPVQLTLRLPHTAPPNTGGQQTVSVQQLHVPSKAQDALQKAQEFFDKGRLDKARQQVAKALSVDPKYSDAFALRGIMALQNGNTESASNDLQQAIQLDNNNAMAYVAMGSVYNRKNEFDNALRELERAESLNPTLWQVHYERSKAQLGKSDYESALQEVTKARSLLGRSYGPLHLLKGRILVGMKAFPDAVAEFQTFLNEDKDNAAASGVRELMEQAKLSAEGQGK